jgi:hypothetical protein
MKPDRAHSKNTYVLWVYVILFVTAFLPALLAVKNIKLSPDSMMYGLISQEILSGNGIKLPVIIDMENNPAFINGLAPHLEEPPLLPLLYAMLGGVTPQDFLPAQIINVISHIAVVIFTFLLMKKLYDNKSIALLTGILVSFSYPLLWDTHYMISESLFIALTVIMLYFLILSRHYDSSKSNQYFFIASVCTSFAILTRYAGLALVPVFFWGILIKNENIKIKYISSIMTALLPVLTAIALFTSTYIVSGMILGRNPPSPGRSYLNAFTGTIKMMLLQFDLGDRQVILIAIFVTLFILYILVNSDTRRELSKYVNSGLDLILLFIISYTVLISLAMAKSQTVFELRYMSPLVPFLFLLCTIIIIVICEMIKSKGFSKLSFWGIILSFSIIIFGNCHKTYMNSAKIFSKDVGQYRILDSPTYHWIKDNYGENVIITSNRPFHLSFFGGYSTIRLPHKRFEINSWLPDNMKLYLPNRMSFFGSHVLALFENVDEQNEGSYLAGLFNKREDDDNFVLIHNFSDGVVYQLRK